MYHSFIQYVKRIKGAIKITLSEAWDLFEADKHFEYSKVTMAGYKIQIKNLLIRWLGDRPVDEITMTDLKQYLVAQKHLKASSLAHRVRVVKAFFGWIRDEGYIAVNPARKLKEPKQPKLIPKAIGEDDLEMIRESCTVPRERALIEFLYSTGCRIGEVVQLNRNAIDWETRSVVVFGKGSKEREIYFNIKCAIWLKRYLKSRKDADVALFVTERKYNGQPRRLSISQMRTVVKNVAGRAGLGEVNVYPHKLRHSYATHLLNNGAPLEGIQSLLGHAKLETTRIYADLSGPRRRDLYQKYFR